MENHFFILSRLGFILKGFCSPLNVFLSYYYFLFLAPWPWLPGCSAKLLKTPPKLSQAPPEPPLGRTGAREGFGSILERPRALKYDK